MEIKIYFHRLLRGGMEVEVAASAGAVGNSHPLTYPACLGVWIRIVRARRVEIVQQVARFD